MWVRYTMLFPVKIILKSTENCSDLCDISVFDGKFNKLVIEKISKKNTKIIMTEISLPTQLIMEIKFHTNRCALDLDRFYLAGIEVNKSVLAGRLEYKYLPNDHTIKSVKQLDDIESHNVLRWNRDGYAVINIFHPNPFAWHLYIDNKIKI